MNTLQDLKRFCELVDERVTYEDLTKLADAFGLQMPKVFLNEHHDRFLLDFPLNQKRKSYRFSVPGLLIGIYHRGLNYWIFDGEELTPDQIFKLRGTILYSFVMYFIYHMTRYFHFNSIESEIFPDLLKQLEDPTGLHKLRITWKPIDDKLKTDIETTLHLSIINVYKG